MVYDSSRHLSQVAILAKPREAQHSVRQNECLDESRAGFNLVHSDSQYISSTQIL